ncbi:hypothetical protein ACM9HF_19775 [Colwellia sp. RE-S-Sl-9]
MKSKVVSVFITTVLCTVALCSTISHAADKQFIVQTVTYTTSGISSNQVIKLVEEHKKINIFSINSFNEVINRPLLNLTSSIPSEYIPASSFTKKNEIFELATIFNDKLQQILAKLSFNQTSQSKDHLMHGDTPKDKNAIQCKNSKNLH